MIAVLPVDVQVAPVMPPPPPLLEDELVELELVLELLVLELLVLELEVELEELELDDPPAPYEQYRGLPTLLDGNREAEHVIGPVNVAYTKLPDFP